MKATFSHYRHFISVDGTFLTGKFIIVLLLAVGVDADGQVLTLAWALVEAEFLGIFSVPSEARPA